MFAGWRLFFYALSQAAPVVLFVDDAESAEQGLIDFLHSILEWSGHHRLLVITCARPQFVDRHQDLLGRSRATILGVDPLDAGTTTELIQSLIPGCPDPLAASLAEKARGLPLYVTELIRSLAGQGVLIEGDRGRWTVVGPLDDVELPASLMALLAARLDALSASDRRLAGAISVFPGAFSARAAAALHAIRPEDVRAGLVTLVRAGIVTGPAETLSAPAGDYVFSHPLIRTVAYDLLTRKERKSRHLAAAEFLESGSGEVAPDVAGTVAAHRLAAFQASHLDPDRAALQKAAELSFARAGERALELGATADAAELFRQAADLATDDSESARYVGKYGWATHLSGRPTGALTILERATQSHLERGDELAAARLIGLQYSARMDTGRLAEGIPGLRWALAAAERGSDLDLAADLRRRLGSALFLSGALAEGRVILEEAVAAAETRQLPSVLGYSLNALGLGYEEEGRTAEAEAVWRKCLDVCRVHHLGLLVGSPLGNLGGLASREDRLNDALAYHRAAADHERRAGNKSQEAISASAVAYTLALQGRGDEAVALCEGFLVDGLDPRSRGPRVRGPLPDRHLAR